MDIETLKKSLKVMPVLKSEIVYNDIVSDIAGNLFLCKYLFEGGERKIIEMKPIDNSIPVQITEE
jgi:hypothetical protein